MSLIKEIKIVGIGSSFQIKTLNWVFWLILAILDYDLRLGIFILKLFFCDETNKNFLLQKI